MHASILLSADNHLRSSQYNRASRGADFAAAFEDLVNTGIARRVSCILIAGDLIDSRRPSPDIIQFLRHIDAKLVAAGIPMYVTSGNHDLTDPHWASLVSDGLRDRGISIIDNQLITIPGTDITIYGQPFVPKEKFLEIKNTLPAADILMFHCMTHEMTPFKAESAFSCENDLPWQKYRVIAIGDIHIQDQWTAPNGSVVLQPGSSELCSSAEPFEKTAYLFSYARPGGAYQIETVPIKTRKVLKFLCTTEQEVEEAIQSAEQWRKEVPLIFVKFDPKLTGVPQRFASRFDPTQFILRMEPMSGKITQGIQLGADVRDDLKLVDFLDKFITPGSRQSELARALLDPQAQVAELVDRFVIERQAETKAVAA
jgi:DNA repair exonuclease SbcCD nuclease subunit